jgi:hypothetical protein
MSGREDKDELEGYRRALLRAHLYTREPLEPPAELDRIVLRAARLAIEPQRPAITPAAHRRRWAVPASVAASVLVALTLVIDLGAHSLRSIFAAAPTLQATTGMSSSSPADAPLGSDVQPSGSGYPSTIYSRLAANGGPAKEPIFEVVIRSARLTAQGASTDARHSSASR